jgi:hypothetical protein
MNLAHVCCKTTGSRYTVTCHRCAASSGGEGVVAALAPRFLGGCLAAVCLVILTGCGDRGPRRVPVEGTVTFDGKPLAAGDIRFLSIPGTAPVVVGTEISEGRFLVPAKAGPLPGKYRVEIAVSRKTGRKVQNPMTEQMVDEIVESLPERYNCRSELTAEVTEAGPNGFDFALTSR